MHVRDITAGNSTVWYGGEKIGNLTVEFTTPAYGSTSGGLVNLTAHVAMSPAAGYVFKDGLLIQTYRVTLI